MPPDTPDAAATGMGAAQLERAAGVFLSCFHPARTGSGDPGFKTRTGQEERGTE